MNSISSRSSESSSRKRWVSKYILIPIFLIIFIITSAAPVFAYDAYCNFYYNGTVANKEVNENEMFRFTGNFEGLEFGIDNTDPAIFEVGRHYTFDVVFGIWFGNVSNPTDEYNNAITSLTTNGYTEEWFAHYVYGFDVGYWDANNNYCNFSADKYYAPQSETVVQYSGVYYSQLTDVLPGLSTAVNTIYQERLYLQVKVHLDFDCTAPITGISIMWQPYQFKPESTGGASIFHTAFDVSNVVSYDYSTINGMELIAYDIKSQIAGMESSLTSTMQELLDQNARYWEVLLGGYEDSVYSAFGSVAYTIIDFQYQSLSELTYINSKLGNIKTTLSTVSSNTASIKQLLNGSTKTLWNFIEEQNGILHQDLVDIKNYLDQTDKSSTMGSDVGNSIGSMMDIAGGGDIQLNDIVTPEFVDESSWNWFSQAVDLVDICLPFLAIVLSFAVFKAVFN